MSYRNHNINIRLCIYDSTLMFHNIQSCTCDQTSKRISTSYIFSQGISVITLWKKENFSFSCLNFYRQLWLPLLDCILVHQEWYNFQYPSVKWSSSCGPPIASSLFHILSQVQLTVYMPIVFSDLPWFWQGWFSSLSQFWAAQFSLQNFLWYLNNHSAHLKTDPDPRWRLPTPQNICWYNLQSMIFS